MMKSRFSILLFSLLSICFASAQQTIGVLENSASAMNGYGLFSVNMKTYLIDNCGDLVNEWSHDTDPGLSCYLTEEGTLIRCGRVNGSLQGSGNGGLIEELDWNGNLIWSSLFSNDTVQQHHDIALMPNGNILLLAWEYRSDAEAISNGAENSLVYWPEHILEIERSGTDGAEVVWEWHVWDHLIQDFDETKDNYGVVADHPELIDINAYPPSAGDWNHFNAIAYNAEQDEIIVSSRTFSEVYIIDHSTTSEEAAEHSGGFHGKGGDFIYRWGNPMNYERGDLDDRRLYSQHDPSWLVPGTPHYGEISIFNNGVFQPDGNYSSIVVIDPPMDAEGHYILEEGMAYGPDNPTWSYVDPDPPAFLSTNQGGVQGLTNGNYLINSTNQGHVFEVTSEGDLVWEYQIPIALGEPLEQGQEWPFNGGGRTFRFQKYLPDFPGFEGLDLLPNAPIELNPFPSDCIIYEDTLTSIDEAESTMQVEITFQAESGILVVEQNENEAIQMTIYDVAGRMVGSEIMPVGIVQLDLNSLIKGLYFAQFINKKGTIRLTRPFLIH